MAMPDKELLKQIVIGKVNSDLGQMVEGLCLPPNFRLQESYLEELANYVLQAWPELSCPLHTMKSALRNLHQQDYRGVAS